MFLSRTSSICFLSTSNVSFFCSMKCPPVSFFVWPNYRTYVLVLQYIFYLNFSADFFHWHLPESPNYWTFCMLRREKK
nr:MAG TPA: hypothetical protein [Caudoviricetes sp.]